MAAKLLSVEVRTPRRPWVCNGCSGRAMSGDDDRYQVRGLDKLGVDHVSHVTLCEACAVALAVKLLEAAGL